MHLSKQYILRYQDVVTNSCLPYVAIAIAILIVVVVVLESDVQGASETKTYLLRIVGSCHAQALVPFEHHRCFVYDPMP